VGQYLHLWLAITPTILTEDEDRLFWKWSADGTYTAKSAYRAAFLGSKRCAAWKLIWKSWAPNRVKFFHWLANLDRCWMAERLARPNLQHHPHRVLYDQAMETMQHLMKRLPLLLDSLARDLSCPPPSDEATLMTGGRRPSIACPGQCVEA
jgi:hypothetical protein